MKNWSDALDAQNGLIRFWRSPAGLELSRRRLLDENAEAAREERLTLLTAAEPVFVAGEISDLIGHAAEAFKPEPLRATDLLIRSGCATFERPLRLPSFDEEEGGTEIIVLVWRQNEDDSGIQLDLYDAGVAEGIEIPGGFSLFESHEWAFGQAFDDSAFATRAVYPWDDETGDLIKGDEDLAMELAQQYNAEWWAMSQVFFRLMMQTIATRRREKAQRPSARRWEREHEDAAPYITVITLRRGRRHEPEDEQDIDWKHRWVVGGHWRNQWFPSLQEHRQIYIAPHVKGPEDKPLVVREGRVFEFVK